MGTTATISPVRYCTDRPITLHPNYRGPEMVGPYYTRRGGGIAAEMAAGYYVSMDGYPRELGRLLVDGRTRNPGLSHFNSRDFAELTCPHTAAEIAAGVHEREATAQHSNWHYWPDPKRGWMAENMHTHEVHTVKGWLFGQKGRPLPGA